MFSSHIDSCAAEQQSTLLPVMEDEATNAEVYERTSARLSRKGVSKLVARMADADAKKRE